MVFYTSLFVNKYKEVVYLCVFSAFFFQNKIKCKQLLQNKNITTEEYNCEFKLNNGQLSKGLINYNTKLIL